MGSAWGPRGDMPTSPRGPRPIASTRFMLDYQTVRLRNAGLRWRLLSAGSAEAADFRSADRDFDVAIAGDLFFQILVQLAFEFANLAAAHASDVDMIAGAMTFVKMPVATEVKKVELVDQTQLLEHFQGPVD